MRKLRHGLRAKLIVAFVAVVAAIGIIGGISYASDNQPFLGDCIEYGIVCNYLNQTVDMETNFVAGKYQGNGHTNGNTVSPDKANASGEIRIGEVVGETQFRGNPLVVIDEGVKKEVKAMLASVSNYSESVVNKKDFTAPEEVKDGNKYEIDITKVKDDLVYVDANPIIDNVTAGKIHNGGLKLLIRADQTIVLNTTVKSKITLPRYYVIVKDGNKTNEEIAESVIWNMPYVDNLQICADNMRATVIAPKAFVNLNAMGEGWLVCDTIVSNNNEWHMISRKVPDVTPTPKETKTPKPTATPTEKPTPTPTATPTEKPTPTPTATPTEKPTPTPTATPTEEPTPTPTATPTEEPTPTPTATPTEKPTPTPTATPTPTPKTGDLVITKTVKGKIAKKEAEKAISFVVTNTVTGKVKELQLKDFEYSEDDDLYTYTLKNVDAGKYTVNETIKDVDGFVLASVTYSVNGADAVAGKEASIDVLSEKKTTVAYKNDYEPEKGNLILTKTIKGPITKEDAEGSISFEITNLETEETVVKKLSDFSYSEEENKYVLFIRDVVGTYHVKEKIVDVDGVELISKEYTVDSSVKTKEGKAGAEANIEKDGSTVVAYENVYAPIVTPTPEPTPTPEVTPTPTPTATPTEEPTPTATPTEEPTPTPTATPSEEPTPTPTATPSEEPTATPSTTPTNTPDAEETPVPSATATATPLVDIDEDTPLATKNLTDSKTPKAAAKSTKSKKTTTLLDDDVPLSDSAPETGDTTNLLFPILAMGLSVLAILAVLVFRRKRSE